NQYARSWIVVVWFSSNIRIPDQRNKRTTVADGERPSEKTEQHFLTHGESWQDTFELPLSKNPGAGLCMPLWQARETLPVIPGLPVSPGPVLPANLGVTRSVCRFD